VKRNNIQFTMYLVSPRFLFFAQTLHCLVGSFFFPYLDTTIFSSLCLLKSLDSLPGGSYLGPLGVGSFSAGCNSPEIHSVGFFESEIQDLTTSWRNLLYLFSSVCSGSCRQKIDECAVYQI
jgi:hypothetical protein